MADRFPSIRVGKCSPSYSLEARGLGADTVNEEGAYVSTSWRESAEEPAPCSRDPRYNPEDEKPWPRCLCIGQFYPSTRLQEEADWVRSLYQDFVSYITFLAEGMLPIATEYDLGLLLVGVQEENLGKVFHFTNWARSLEHPEVMRELAPSMADLVGQSGEDLEE